MGIVICYKGRLHNPNAVISFKNEVKAFCEMNDCAFDLHSGSIKGISLLLPDSELFHLTFDSKGRLWPPENQGLPYSKEPSRNYLYVRTQEAGPLIHAFIIKILKWLSLEYLADLEVTDESQYWETDDFDLLCRNFGMMDSIIGKARSMEAAFAQIASEGPQSLAQHMADELSAALKSK
ncbi:MAG: hypothetical protein BGO55_08530 [Sphingobacteriales bacterium 50-39]|nr:hypothetical protein [Sphingobacteriales bacterium]OJW59309.1 MAG: hypothetical protein BGO55_08530 [Sphingobacteriales bacterium 50-39]